jgi:hypothetical protein
MAIPIPNFMKCTKGFRPKAFQSTYNLKMAFLHENIHLATLQETGRLA